MPRYTTRALLVGVALVLLTTSAGCSGQECRTHTSTFCKEGISYWVDSCGTIEEQEEICLEGCSGDSSGCLKQCATAGDCPVGRACVAGGTCGNCQASAECRTAETCQTGVCRSCLGNHPCCGDGTCETSEDPQSCPADCGWKCLHAPPVPASWPPVCVPSSLTGTVAGTPEGAYPTVSMTFDGTYLTSFDGKDCTWCSDPPRWAPDGSGLVYVDCFHHVHCGDCDLFLFLVYNYQTGYGTWKVNDFTSPATDCYGGTWAVGSTLICQRQCSGKACGDDGCGGKCGVCTGTEKCVSGRCCTDCSGCLNSCNESGLPGCCCGSGCVCESDCTPACGNKC